MSLNFHHHFYTSFFKEEISRVDLKKMQNSELIIKQLQDQFKLLEMNSLLASICKLVSNYYAKLQKQHQGMFFELTASKIGRQRLENHLDLIKVINHPWSTGLTNDTFRILLK